MLDLAQIYTGHEAEALSNNGVVALISALISSIALLGVVVSLILQAWQLRASRLQTARLAQVELVRLSIEHPDVLADNDTLTGRPDYTKKWAYINWLFKQLELSYLIKINTKAAVRWQSARAFESQAWRDWWSEVGKEAYSVEASRRRERQFLRLVDDEFRRAEDRAQNLQKKLDAGTSEKRVVAKSPETRVPSAGSDSTDSPTG